MAFQLCPECGAERTDPVRCMECQRVFRSPEQITDDVAAMQGKLAKRRSHDRELARLVKVLRDSCSHYDENGRPNPQVIDLLDLLDKIGEANEDR